MKAIPVVPSIKESNGPKPQFDKAAGAGAAAPVALKVQSTEPAALPSDNAPVLLRPANAKSGSAVRLKPLATGAAGGQSVGVTKDTAEEATPEKVEPRSSTIVF
jgi:hypothetical protein